MPDPNDPRDAALQSIQDSSRAYGRGRRRGNTSDVDPAFAAALEITDPEQRRAALAQYARQRAQALFQPEGSAAVVEGSVLMQPPQAAPAPMPAPEGPDGDILMDLGREMSARDKMALAPTYQDQVDERNDRNDDFRIESRNAGKPPPDEYVADPLAGIGSAAVELQNSIQARRRR